MFRSGFAAALAERVQRQRWARALIRHGYESQTQIKAKTLGAAWEHAWENLNALGIEPERTMKGAFCAPVYGIVTTRSIGVSGPLMPPRTTL